MSETGEGRPVHTSDHTILTGFMAVCERAAGRAVAS
jgi:hypothetical protein